MSQFPATECGDCGTVYGHPPDVCRNCQSDTLDERPIPGTGTVYATTTIHVPSATFQDEAPYEVCLVDVGSEESVRVTARLTDRHDLNPGDDVRFVEQRNQTFYFKTDD